MNTIKSLTDMQEGDRGAVAALKLKGSIRRRLQDLGVVEGTEIQCLQKSPYGDPVAYLIRGAVIALREEDASQVLLA